MTVREVDALRAKRGPSATSEPTHTCFSRAPLFRLGILMPFGEPASASPPGHWTSESGRRPFHSSVPASPRPSCRKGRACQVKLPTSVHDLRNRCSTSSGIDVPLPPDSVFHFLRIRCSTSSGFMFHFLRIPCHFRRNTQPPAPCPSRPSVREHVSLWSTPEYAEAGERPAQAPVCVTP